MQRVVERKQVLEVLSLLLGQHEGEQLSRVLQVRGSLERRFHASQSIRNYILYCIYSPKLIKPYKVAAPSSL